MHDLLFPLSLRKGEYDIKYSETHEACKEPTRQNERGEYSIPKSCINKTQKLFSKNEINLQQCFKIPPRIRERVEQNYSAKNVLRFFQETLFGRKLMQLESDLQMWKLQYEWKT